jgi:transposase
MEATGIYWKPVWHILAAAAFALILANAAHVKNVPGRKTAHVQRLQKTLEDANIKLD